MKTALNVILASILSAIVGTFFGILIGVGGYEDLTGIRVIDGWIKGDNEIRFVPKKVKKESKKRNPIGYDTSSTEVKS